MRGQGDRKKQSAGTEKHSQPDSVDNFHISQLSTRHATLGVFKRRSKLDQLLVKKHPGRWQENGGKATAASDPSPKAKRTPGTGKRVAVVAEQKAVHLRAPVPVFRTMQSAHLLAQLHAYGITVTPWKIVGWLGAGIFGARFLIQWIASERAKRSVIPFGFWECSALGSFLLLTYFAVYRHDSVGVLQNILPLPIYLRNLYFRYSHRGAQHPGSEPRVEE